MIDELNGETSEHIFAKSPNWTLVVDEPDQLEGDMGDGCVQIMKKVILFINLQDMHDFDIRMFLKDGTHNLNIYRSSDNQLWTELDLIESNVRDLDNGWKAVTYSPKEGLPQSSDYLKISFSGSDFSSQQLSSLGSGYGISQEPEKNRIM